MGREKRERWEGRAIREEMDSVPGLSWRTHSRTSVIVPSINTLLEPSIYIFKKEKRRYESMNHEIWRNCKEESNI